MFGDLYSLTLVTSLHANSPQVALVLDIPNIDFFESIGVQNN